MLRWPHAGRIHDSVEQLRHWEWSLMVCHRDIEEGRVARRDGSNVEKVQVEAR